MPNNSHSHHGRKYQTGFTNTLNQVMRRDVGGDTWSYSWDANGNLTGKTNGTDSWIYTWDLDNRLKRVQGPGAVDVNYQYDMTGRMISRDDGTAITTFWWDHWDCIREKTGESVTTYCIPEGQILSFIRDGDRFDCSCDALGSVRMVTDSTGAVVARFDYGAWGELLASSFDSVPGGMPYSFIGAYGCRTDLTTGLVYMRQRWYDSSLGRFISRDPIGLSGGTNLYSYCGNRPVNEVDPTGNYSVEGSAQEKQAIQQALRDISRKSQTGKDVYRELLNNDNIVIKLVDKNSSGQPAQTKKEGDKIVISLERPGYWRRPGRKCRTEDMAKDLEILLAIESFQASSYTLKKDRIDKIYAGDLDSLKRQEYEANSFGAMVADSDPDLQARVSRWGDSPFKGLWERIHQGEKESDIWKWFNSEVDQQKYRR